VGRCPTCWMSPSAVYPVECPPPEETVLLPRNDWVEMSKFLLPIKLPDEIFWRYRSLWRNHLVKWLIKLLWSKYYEFGFNITFHAMPWIHIYVFCLEIHCLYFGQVSVYSYPDQLYLDFSFKYLKIHPPRQHLTMH